MNVQRLQPCPEYRENFRRDRQRFLPEAAGCYVLASFHDVVLYVGLTKDLRRRFGDHLNDPKKSSTTANGRAFFFYWLECEEVEKVERTWQNECMVVGGTLPILNDVASPVSI